MYAVTVQSVLNTLLLDKLKTSMSLYINYSVNSETVSNCIKPFKFQTNDNFMNSNYTNFNVKLSSW